MFCRNCGSKNDDGATFCRECGAKLVVDANTAGTNPTPGFVPAGQQINVPNFANVIDLLKQLPKKVLAGIVGGFVALIVLIVVIVNVNSTINLDKYIEVKCEGYEGYGRAYVTIDWAGINNKYGSKLKYTQSGMDEYGDYMPPISALSEFIDAPELETKEGLSNGDKINYTWDIDENELQKYIKCKIKYKDKSITVSDLEEVDTFDPFEKLKVQFNGVGPAGSVSFDYTGDYIDSYSFYAEPSSGLSNGDKVVISIGSGNPESFVAQYGKMPATMEKEYVVEGLGSYVTKTSEIDEDTLAKIEKKTDSVVSELTSDYSTDTSIDSVECLGTFVASANDANAYTHNSVGVVYKIDSHIQASEDYDAVAVTQYYYVAFENVVVKEDGTVEIELDSYNTPRNSFNKKAYYGNYSFSYNYYYFYGSESLPGLASDIMSSFGSDYTYDWDVEGFDSENVAGGSEDYLCAYSSSRQMTSDEVEEYLANDYSSYNFPGDRTIVQMIINEMYARYGYQFSDNELTNYFNNKEWYRDMELSEDDMEAIYKSMTSVEQDNITLLQEYQ